MFGIYVICAAIVGIILGTVLANMRSQSMLQNLYRSEAPLLSATVFIIVTSALGRSAGMYGHGFADFAYLISVVVVGAYAAKHGVNIYRGIRRLNRDRT